MSKLGCLKFALFFALMTNFVGAAESFDSALDKVFYNAELKRVMAPSDPLWKVISVASWNIQSGTMQKEIVKQLKDASVDERGPVADYLFRQGFNYHVLIRLRWVLGYDPDGLSYGVFDLAQLENTMIGRAEAGIPEFMRVENEHWQADSRGELVMRFDPKIHWLLEKLKGQIDLGVRESERTPHSLRNLFVNRYRQIQLLADFGLRFEKISIQIQAMQASIKIKQAELGQSSSDLIKRTNAVAIEWQKTRDGFLDWAEKISAATPTIPRGRQTWEPLVRAIESSSSSLSDWERRTEQANLKAIEDLDKVFSRNDSSNRYAGDTAAELEIKRQEHLKKQNDFIDFWEKNSSFSYYRRTHKWPYKHLHSEEHGPYTLMSTETRQREIYDIDLAPQPEVELAALLTQEGERLLERRQQKEQILELRRRLEGFKKNQLIYAASGPKRPNVVPAELGKGFEERFKIRNQKLNEWLDFLMDESYRQEAHEARGYLGLDLNKALSEDYESVLNKLNVTARKFAIARNTLFGIGASGAAACAWYLMSGSPGGL